MKSPKRQEIILLVFTCLYKAFDLYETYMYWSGLGYSDDLLTGEIFKISLFHCFSLFSPQILCIHLKRFKHEMYFSSKINHFISFPLTGLDMKPFVVKGIQL